MYIFWYSSNIFVLIFYYYSWWREEHKLNACMHQKYQNEMNQFACKGNKRTKIILYADCCTATESSLFWRSHFMISKFGIQFLNVKYAESDCWKFLQIGRPIILYTLGISFLIPVAFTCYKQQKRRGWAFSYKNALK